MKARLFLLVLSAICAARVFARSDSEVASNLPPPARDLMSGKIQTAHTIRLETTVDASPADAFRLWTTAEGVKKFFAPDAKIDSAVGGRYHIFFFPSKDPEGNSHGTNGARILKFKPGTELAFEWITFAGDELLGNNAPPFASTELRNMRPLPTWVELHFEKVAGRSNRTHIRFAHYGFRSGEIWERSYQWFERAWKSVLAELTATCAKQQS